MKRAPRSLASLPNEILHHILLQLQPVASPREFGYLPVLVEAEVDKQAALLSLVRTSKAFHALATPLLYATVTPPAPAGFPLELMGEIEGLSSCFSSTSHKINYTHIRHLHLFLSKDHDELDHHVRLDILAQCAESIVELSIQGDSEYMLPGTCWDRLILLLERAGKLRHLALSFPNLSPGHMQNLTGPLAVQIRSFSSMQLVPPPHVPFYFRHLFVEPSLIIQELHLQMADSDGEGGRDPLASIQLLCRPNKLQTLSFSGSTTETLWTPGAQRLDGLWTSLKEIRLDSDVSWRPLRFHPTLAPQASTVLPVLHTLKTTLPWAAEDPQLMQEIRCYPSNLVRLHIDKFWWRVPGLLADLLSLKPDLLPCFRSLELGFSSLTLQRRQVALSREGSQPDGADALQRICQIRGIKTKPGCLTPTYHPDESEDDEDDDHA